MQNIGHCQVSRRDEGGKYLSVPALVPRRHLGLGTLVWRLRRDRKGAVSALAAVTTAAFLGLVGLAIEGGYWYVGNRQGQNGADVAAIAGAMTFAKSENHASTLLAGANGAQRNGFATGGKVTVTINHPPSSGKYATNNWAVEAIIDQVEDLGISRLFNLSSMTVSNRAVALIEESGEACILALSRTLTLSGNMEIDAPNCILAGNKETGDSIIVSGSADVDVGALVAVAECDGCDDPDLVSSSTITMPYTTAPTENPFESLDAQVWPTGYSTSDTVTCDNTNYGSGGDGVTGTLLPTASNTPNSEGLLDHNNGGRAYCGGLHMTSGDVIQFKPGIYVFYEADIMITGGTLTCDGCDADNGVHIVQIDLTGHLDGLQINSGASVQLSAGTTVPAFPTVTGVTAANPTTAALDGVLYHRTLQSQDKNGDEIIINGDSTTTLVGGMYAPNGDFRYNGNSSSSCSVIVGAGVTLNGDTTLDQSSCTNIGLVPVKTRVVVLVE